MKVVPLGTGFGNGRALSREMEAGVEVRSTTAPPSPLPLEDAVDQGVHGVELKGIEPLTSSLRTTRSTN